MSCKSRDKAQRPSFSSQNPVDSWRIQPSNRCTTVPYQINQKKVTTPGKHVLKPVSCNVAFTNKSWAVSWASLKKEVVAVAASNYAYHCQSQNGDSPAQRAIVQHIDLDRVKSWKVNDCFSLLKRITNSKVWIRRSSRRIKRSASEPFPEGLIPSWRSQYE